jgi:hypothetical protein
MLLYTSPRRPTSYAQHLRRLGNKGRRGRGLVLERRGDLLLLDVVAGQTVDTGLDENHAAEQGSARWKEHETWDVGCGM